MIVARKAFIIIFAIICSLPVLANGEGADSSEYVDRIRGWVSILGVDHPMHKRAACEFRPENKLYYVTSDECGQRLADQVRFGSLVVLVSGKLSIDADNHHWITVTAFENAHPAPPPTNAACVLIFGKSTYYVVDNEVGRRLAKTEMGKTIRVNGFVFGDDWINVSEFGSDASPLPPGVLDEKTRITATVAPAPQ